MTLYSISAASRITGKSRTTLSKHLASGKLSSVAGEEGARMIDASELIRVYGAVCDFSREEGPTSTNSGAATATKATEQGPAGALPAQLAKEIAERERERAHYRQQIDYLQDALKLAQESQSKAMLLLEHRTTGGGEWQAAIKQLEERIATREADLARAQREAAVQAKRQAREELLAQPWWRLVFST